MVASAATVLAACVALLCEGPAAGAVLDVVAGNMSSFSGAAPTATDIGDVTDAKDLTEVRDGAHVSKVADARAAADVWDAVDVRDVVAVSDVLDVASRTAGWTVQEVEAALTGRVNGTTLPGAGRVSADPGPGSRPMTGAGRNGTPRDRRAVSRLSAGTTVKPATSAVPVSSVVGLAGGDVSLPCDMSHPPGDTVLIVLWYRDGSDAPVYSYDLRNAMETDRRWHNATVFGSRVTFVPGRQPAVLTLRDLGPADQSLYKCRVDFQHSRTRNALVNLTVIVPPESVEILDAGGAVLDTVVGAFMEGEQLQLTCRVSGGSPRPSVTWRSSEGVLPAPSQPQGEYTVSRYTVTSLARADLHRMLTCLASNTNLTAPSTSSVMIDMNFAPLSVSILGKGEPLSAGRRYPLVCQCVGSRPPAAITWFLGSSRMATVPGTTIHRGNVTMSTLHFLPRPEDHGKVIKCHCQNPVIVTPLLKDSWKLTVHYAPIIRLTLGSSLDRARIKEGDDVYFECSIKANPPVYKKEWRHNNRVLHQSAEDNVIISNYSLVLQDVKRSSSGVYMCVGINVEGDADSNPVFLDVKFPPVCRPGVPSIHGVSKRETATILCDVIANPAEVRFDWTFNNTSEWRELDSRLVNSSETRSTLRYQPRTEMDYGTVFCSATNDIGRMARPCVFHIIAAGPPDPLYNCSITNRTAAALSVRCLEAFDGGLVQEFLLTVFSYDNQVYNKTSTRPQWHVEGLIPSQRHRIQAFSQNAKGRSVSVTLPVDPLSGPETHVEKIQDFTLAEMLPEPASRSPMLAIVLGGLGSLVLLLLAAIVVTLTRRRGRRQRSLLAPPSQLAAEPGTGRGPDLVTGSNGAGRQVYRIPPDIPALPEGVGGPAAATGQRGARLAADIPLRVFLAHPHQIYHHYHHHHHQPPQSNSAPTVPPCFSATLPPLHRRPLAPDWTQGSGATLDRRRTHGLPPDTARAPLIGGRPAQGALIGYSIEGCSANESAL